MDAESIDPNSTYAFLLELANHPSSVLDVGCNTGYLGRLFLELGSHVCGIDIDEDAVRQARDAGIEAVTGDLDLVGIADLFPDQRFDAVIFADVLEHLKDPDRVLAESRDLLAPGGRVLASVPNVAHGNVRLDLLLGRFHYSSIGLLDNTHLRFFTAETIDLLFRNAGFVIDEVRRVRSLVDGTRIEEAVAALGLSVGAPELLALLGSEAAETFQYVVSAHPGPGPGTGVPDMWTLGDQERPPTKAPSYLAVEVVPNVVADMRRTVEGLEASLAETQQHLAAVIRDKDRVIAGLEASLADTRAALTTQDRDRRLATSPTVTVVVVNWNGKDLLSDCLGSLRHQTYPDPRYRVVVVDNASSDGSAAFVRNHFPDVVVVEAGSNLGFAGGNNLGIAATESDYIALLNNDAVAEPGWLEELVTVAERDPHVAAVNSKIWLYRDRLVLTATVSDTFVPGPHDDRRLGAAMRPQAMVGDAVTDIEFTRGAFGPEHDTRGSFRWLSESAELRVPLVDPDATEVVLHLLPRPQNTDKAIRFELRCGGDVVAEVAVPRDEPLELRIDLEGRHRSPVVQNAGSVILPNGAGSDRGSLVVGTEVFYDVDRGQYDAVEDVPAFCGAACLLRRSALAEVGAFDDGFFMYYEDTDLALRLRRAGWRIVYAPASVVRHHHAATSVEWSPRFCYFTERNRLLMLVKNGDAGLALKEWGRYAAAFFRPGESHENRKRYLSVQRSLLRHLPGALRARARRPPGPGPIGFQNTATPATQATDGVVP